MRMLAAPACLLAGAGRTAGSCIWALKVSSAYRVVRGRCQGELGAVTMCLLTAHTCLQAGAGRTAGSCIWALKVSSAAVSDGRVAWPATCEAVARTRLRVSHQRPCLPPSGLMQGSAGPQGVFSLCQGP